MEVGAKLVKIGCTLNGANVLKLLKVETSSFSDLLAMVSQSFAQNFLGYSLVWNDADGDSISITGDRDLELFFQTGPQPYKCRLERIAAPTLNPKAAEFKPVTPEVVIIPPIRQPSPPRPQSNVRAVARPKLNARFVKHTTCDDETSTYAPGTKFFKTWRFRNDGGLKWPTMIHLLFVSKLTGDSMGGPEDLPVIFPEQIEIGKEIDISVPLIAPEKTGEYVGFWKLADETSKKFGQRVRCRIHVAEVPQTPSEKEREILNELNDNGFDRNAQETALIHLRTSKVDLKYDDIEIYLGRLGIRQSLN